MPPSSRGRLLAVCCVAIGLALLLAGAAGLAASAADSSGLGASTAEASAADVSTPPEPTTGIDLPARMELSGPITGGSTYVGVDVGAAVHGGSTEIDAAYDSYHLNVRLDRAESDAEREDVIRDAIDRSNASARELRERERNARSEYASGDIGEREFVARLRAINDRAAARDSVRSTIQSRASEVDDALEDDATRLTSGFVARQGEVRSIVSQTTAGDQSPSRVYVAADGSGAVLSTVRGTTYHRETNRDDLFQRPGSTGMTTDELISILTGMYSMYDDWGYVLFMADDTISQVREDHEHGEVQVYFDVASEDVFREYQQIDLDDATPTLAPTNTSSGGLEIGVARTYPSGPARVVVTEAGQPVADAPVTVDGTEVARTGPDGVAWVVAPYGDASVGTSMQGTSVTAPLRWTSPDPSD